MANLLRSFIAILLTSSIHHELKQFVANSGLAERDAGFRPVAAENIHLTLKFLGDVEISQLPRISANLNQITMTLSPIAVCLRGLSAFPGWKNRPRLIWVGVQPVGEIQKIYEMVDSSTVALGCPSEGRKFSPHLTLARINRQPSNPRQYEVLNKLMAIKPEPFFGEMVAREVILYKSVLQSSGPVYTVLSRHAFSG